MPELSNRCEFCSFKSEPVKHLNIDELKLIESNCNIVSFNKNELIIKQGTPVTYLIYIRKGLVKITKTSSKGIERIFHILKSNEFIGLSELLSKNKYNFSAVSVEPTEVCYLIFNDFYKLMDQNPIFSKKIAEYNSLAEDKITNRLHNIIYKQVPGRVSDLLLFLAEEIYRSNTFMLTLNRNELAEYIGTSKKSFIQTLSEFKNDRLINIKGKKIEIIRIDLLKRLSRVG